MDRLLAHMVWAKSWTTNNLMVVSIVDDNFVKGPKAHAYIQFNS